MPTAHGAANQDMVAASNLRPEDDYLKVGVTSGVSTRRYASGVLSIAGQPGEVCYRPNDQCADGNDSQRQTMIVCLLITIGELQSVGWHP